MSKTKNLFAEIADFNTAIGNDPAGAQSDKSVLYKKLLEEEYTETLAGFEKLFYFLHDPETGKITITPRKLNDIELLDAVTELADGLVDTIVIAAGWLHIIGLSGKELFDEVNRSNWAKRDPVTGNFEKRSDGKVIKPAGWTAPNLRPLVAKQLGLVRRRVKDLDAHVQAQARKKAAAQQALSQGSIVGKLLTVSQAASVKNKSESWIRAQCKAGKLAHQRFGAQLAIPEEALGAI